MGILDALVTLTLLSSAVTALPRETRSVTLTASSGTITSPGYPNGYDQESGETWKLRVVGADSYTLYFDVVDLDVSACYDYITLYDDNDYAAPGETICNKPVKPYLMTTSEMTITFNVASNWVAGARGNGFSLRYQANGADFTTTATSVTATTKASTTTEIYTTTVGISASTEVNFPGTSTTKKPAPTTTTVGSTTTVNSGGNFPPGNQDDSQCGVPSVTPEISGFDYVSQGQAVSYSRSFGSPKVVNGEEVVPHSWPWQVALQGSYGSSYCGGTLVQAQWVVTAAHCADLVFIGTYGGDQALLGAHDRSNEGATVQKIDIIEKYVHPQYDHPDRSHDVCMLKLKTPAVLNEYVSLACEAHEDWNFPPDMYCVVTGWGVTKEGGNIGSMILNQAAVPLLSDEACHTLYQEANLDTTSDMQCAGGEGKGACNGDSGGPLNCYVNNRWYHMGIVSFGEANCNTDIASVYARVAELREFIDSTIAANS